MENISEVNLTNTFEYMKFKSQFHGLKKIKTALKNAFSFIEIAN